MIRNTRKHINIHIDMKDITKYAAIYYDVVQKNSIVFIKHINTIENIVEGVYIRLQPL